MDRPMQPAAVRRTYWVDSWSGWHLDWGAVWIGALAMLVAAVLFSFIATAVGAQKAIDARVLKWAEVPAVTIIFSVLGAFFASAIGAWLAVKVSGARFAEPAILHGVAAWLVVITIVIVLAAIAGAHSLAGGYLGNMTPPGAPAPAAGPVDPNAAIAIRNAAMGSILGLVIGLMGAVVGAWVGSGDELDIWNHETQKHYRRTDRWTTAGDYRRSTT